MLVDWRDSPLLPRVGRYSQRSAPCIGLVIHNTGGMTTIQADNYYHEYQAAWDPAHPDVKGGAPHIAYHLWAPYDPVAFLEANHVAYDRTNKPPASVVVWCNELTERSWHATRANDEYVGLALQVDGEKEEASPAQQLAVLWVIDTFLPKQGISISKKNVWGHGELGKVYCGGPDYGNNTVCPGKKVLPFVQSIRSGQ